MFRRWFILATAAVSGLLMTAATPAQIPSTRPAGWPDAVKAIAADLASGDAGTVAKDLPDPVKIRLLSGGRSDIATLAGLVESGAKILSVRAYSKAPSTLATDLAADVDSASAADLTDAVRAELVPDDQAMPRADATARLWLGRQLAAGEREPVGMIVLWLNAGTTSADRLLFVLVKADRATQTHVADLVFGDPSRGSR